MSGARPSADRPVLAQPCGAASLERRTWMPKVLRFGLWWAGTDTPTLECFLVAKKLGRLAREPRASRGDCGDPGAGGAGDAGARAREAGVGIGTSKGWMGAVPGSVLRAGNRVAPIHSLIDSRVFGRLRGGGDTAVLAVGSGIGGSPPTRPLPERLGESFIPAAPDAPRTRL